ncbi:MAG TPA: tetratricopeptide repeat protein [Gemmatimonadaceae bacterium]|nr:tetratricopeptide repeat protein [Gemmatimonadaceae bacterium]
MSLRSTILCLLCAVAPLRAQQTFTTQIMVVPAFHGPDRGLDGKTASIVRDRVADAFPKRELRVISGGDVDDWLRQSSYEENAQLSEGELKLLAEHFRADERITGTVARVANGVQVTAALSLIRDLRLSQPFAASGPSVDVAAGAVAREAIAARRQLIPLRRCENAERANRLPEAVSDAAAGIAAYPKAVPARLCLLTALIRLSAPNDSVVAVARAVLDVAPTNPVALEDLAQAYDAEGKSNDAAPAWMRFLATDSTNEDLLERVVNALSREGKTHEAQPIVDRGVAEHADNLRLRKLQWLVHLANSDWKNAIGAGESLLVRDAAARVDPDFYTRLATAYRADSQTTHALSVAALAVSKFPKDPSVQLVYLQLLQAEQRAALPRALAQFPNDAPIHVFAAEAMKSAGNTAGARAELEHALAENPRLPHGYLQLSQILIDAGEPDSALAAMQLAAKHGEDSSVVAQFALARGNALYKAAGTTQKRDDYQRAMRFIAFAVGITPTPEAKFLLGATALGVSQSAATEAPATKSCDLSRLAASALTDAEVNLVSGGSVAPDAAKQYLDYVAKLRPYVDNQVKTFCTGAP